MALIDDIKGETPTSETGGFGLPKNSPRSIGPESEARGGSEAPAEPLTDNLE